VPVPDCLKSTHNWIVTDSAGVLGHGHGHDDLLPGTGTSFPIFSIHTPSHRIALISLDKSPSGWHFTRLIPKASGGSKRVRRFVSWGGANRKRGPNSGRICNSSRRTQGSASLCSLFRLLRQLVAGSWNEGPITGWRCSAPVECSRGFGKNIHTVRLRGRRTTRLVGVRAMKREPACVGQGRPTMPADITTVP